MRVPVDNVVLAAVADEAGCLAGSALERVWEPEPGALVLGLWSDAERWLLLCASGARTRAHLLTRRPSSGKPSGLLARAVLQHLEGAALTHVAQRGDDRVLDLYFEAESGRWVLVAELTGRMPNVLLVDPGGVVQAAMRWLGPGSSTRPVVPKQPYSPPPGAPPLPSAPSAAPALVRPSPFALKLAAAGVDVEGAWAARAWQPVYAHGHGAYPLDLAPLGLACAPRASISQALEQAFGEDAAEADETQQRKSLQTQLERALLAKESAAASVREAVETGARSRELQSQAELLLAYQHMAPKGASEAVLPGYDGTPTKVRLDPDLDAVENAAALFARAKQARRRAEGLASQLAAMESEAAEIRAALATLPTDDVARLAATAAQRGWFRVQRPAAAPTERPFAGHAVRETTSPGGWRLLYGENATSNDYLTTKLAKPRDLWFHVRGAPSAHVVLATDNQPHRVQMPDIMAAAALAASKSPQKHSGYVAVDYTERRYVRKPRGAAPGLAVYTHEKTVHVEP